MQEKDVPDNMNLPPLSMEDDKSNQESELLIANAESNEINKILYSPRK